MVLCLLVLFYLRLVSGNIWTREMDVIEDGDVRIGELGWIIEDDDLYIKIEMMRTEGWIGVGFSYIDDIHRADLAIGWMTGEGETRVNVSRQGAACRPGTLR